MFEKVKVMIAIGLVHLGLVGAPPLSYVINTVFANYFWSQFP